MNTSDTERHVARQEAAGQRHRRLRGNTMDESDNQGRGSRPQRPECSGIVWAALAVAVTAHETIIAPGHRPLPTAQRELLGETA